MKIENIDKAIHLINRLEYFQGKEKELKEMLGVSTNIGITSSTNVTVYFENSESLLNADILRAVIELLRIEIVAVKILIEKL